MSSEQERLVAPVVRSLSDAFVYQGAIAHAAYAGEGAVGFLLLYPFEQDGRLTINVVRLMIDHQYQGQGYGRALLDAALAYIEALTPKPDRVRISTVPDNGVALRLYRSAGFEEDGVDNGEIVLWRPV